MYNYQDIEKISGVKSKITQRILKKQKMHQQTIFSDRDVKVIITEVEKYEMRKVCIQLFLVVVMIGWIINLYM